MQRIVRALALAFAVALAGLAMAAAPASAGWTCAGAPNPCMITLTATVRDPSRSGSTAVRILLPGAMGEIECDDSTFSDVMHPDRFRPLAFRGVDVTFTGCRFKLMGVDDRCTVTATPDPRDNTWLIYPDETQSAFPIPSSDVRFENMGQVTFAMATCATRSSTGTFELLSGNRTGSRAVSCMRYTNAMGIFTPTGCPLPMWTSTGNITTTRLTVPGFATLTGSWHAIVDANRASPQQGA